MMSSEPTPWPMNIWLAVAGVNGLKYALLSGQGLTNVLGGFGGLGCVALSHQRTVAFSAMPAPSMLSRVKREL